MSRIVAVPLFFKKKNPMVSIVKTIALMICIISMSRFVDAAHVSSVKKKYRALSVSV